MFIIIFIFIVLLFKPAESEIKIVFPQNRFSIFQQKWVSCNDESIIYPQNNEFNQPTQLPISYNRPLCLYDLIQVIKFDPMNFYYFVFNRPIDTKDLLIIKIDGKNYTITQETAMNNFVLIRHKRICYYNSIEFWMISKSQDLALLNYFILLETETSSANNYNQVLKQSILNITEEYQFTQYNLQTKHQQINNSILQYEGLLSFENIELIASCLEFQLFNYNQQMMCKNLEINENIKFICELDLKQIKDLNSMKDLGVLFQSQYTFVLRSPCFPNLPYQIKNFQTIQQISQDYSSVNNYIQEKEFNIQNQINLLYDFQISLLNNNTIALITLDPKSCKNCIDEFEEAFISIKNSMEEIINCRLNQDFDSNSCLSYTNNLFRVDLDLQENLSYSFNLTATVKKVDLNHPSVQFVLNDIVLKEGIREKEKNFDFTIIIVLVILIFFLPLICFLMSTFYFRLSLYNGLIKDIYDKDKMIFCSSQNEVQNY